MNASGTPPRAPYRSALAAVALALAGALAAAGCGGHGDATHEATSLADEREPANVTIARAMSAGGRVLALVPARVEAAEEVTVVAKIPARLTRFPLAEGAEFRRGALLAEFSAAETRQAVAAARAALEAAERQRDVARVQEARMDSLQAARIATRRELEMAQAAHRSAEAARASAEAALSALLADTEVRAPFDGVVVRRHVDPGSSVQPGAPLLDIRSAAVGAIAAPLPESVLGEIANARFEAQVGDGPWLTVRLLRLDGMTDPATRTRTARFAPEDAGATLEAGAFARVRVRSGAAGAPGAEAGALRVPTDCIIRRGALRGIFVVKDGRASLRWIRAGRESSAETEILAGLGADEDIVLAPGNLVDGQRIVATP